MVLSMKGQNNSDGSFNWKDAVIDAGISAGLTFCTSLGGITAVATLTEVTATAEVTLVGSVVAACTQFFLVLAIKRGIKEKPREIE